MSGSKHDKLIPAHHKHAKEKQLKIFVTIGATIIFIVWIYWVASGNLLKYRDSEETGLWSQIRNSTTGAVSGFSNIKQKAQQQYEIIQTQQEVEEQVLEKMKEKLAEDSATTTPTSTDIINNNEQEEDVQEENQQKGS